MDKKNAIKELSLLKENCKEDLSLTLLAGEVKDISNQSMSLIQNRISIKKYNDRYALKRNFYKPIITNFPL